MNGDIVDAPPRGGEEGGDEEEGWGEDTGSPGGGGGHAGQLPPGPLPLHFLLQDSSRQEEDKQAHCVSANA